MLTGPISEPTPQIGKAGLISGESRPFQCKAALITAISMRRANQRGEVVRSTCSSTTA